VSLTLLPCIKAQKGQKFRFDFKNPPPCAHALGKCRPEWKNKKKTSAKGKIKVEEEGEGMLSQLEGNFRLPNNPPNIFLVRPTHKRSEPLKAVSVRKKLSSEEAISSSIPFRNSPNSRMHQIFIEKP
jgi:hypothetical protein